MGMPVLRLQLQHVHVHALNRLGLELFRQVPDLSRELACSKEQAQPKQHQEREDPRERGKLYSAKSMLVSRQRLQRVLAAIINASS